MVAISIPSGLTDDNDFVGLLNALLNALVTQQETEQLWVIQIDNWFDHKWLRYSGSGTVNASKLFPPDWTSSFMDRFASVKEQFWRDKLTFPPFAPERVAAQWSFLHTESGYIEVPLAKLPHSESKRRSHAYPKCFYPERCCTLCFSTRQYQQLGDPASGIEEVCK